MDCKKRCVDIEKPLEAIFIPLIELFQFFWEKKKMRTFKDMFGSKEQIPTRYEAIIMPASEAHFLTMISISYERWRRRLCKIMPPLYVMSFHYWKELTYFYERLKKGVESDEIGQVEMLSEDRSDSIHLVVYRNILWRSNACHMAVWKCPASCYDWHHNTSKLVE